MKCCIVSFRNEDFQPLDKKRRDTFSLASLNSEQRPERYGKGIMKEKAFKGSKYYLCSTLYATNQGSYFVICETEEL